MVICRALEIFMIDLISYISFIIYISYIITKNQRKTYEGIVKHLVRIQNALRLNHYEHCILHRDFADLDIRPFMYRYIIVHTCEILL